jgi:DNA modification methylase
MGKHLLYKGDCLVRIKEIEDNSIQCTISSPPYYNAKEYNMEEENIGNNKSYEHYNERINTLIKELFRVTCSGGLVCWNTSPVICEGFRYMLPIDQHKLFLEAGFVCRDRIMWKKPDGCAAPRSGSWYANKGKPLTWHPNLVFEDVVVYKKSGDRQEGDFSSIFSYYPSELPKDLLTDVWFINPETNKSYHDAPFPEELVKRCILIYTFKGDTVFDPFVGTGTVMRVARDLGRNSVGIELSEEYIAKAKEEMGWYQKSIFSQETYEER